MADGRVLKNQEIAISQQWFNRLPRNLVWCRILTPLNLSTV